MRLVALLAQSPANDRKENERQKKTTIELSHAVTDLYFNPACAV